MVGKIMAVIGGAFLGVIVGTFIRLLVTKLILVPFIVPYVHPSAQTYGDAPIINIVGGLIQLACMVIGAWIFYRRFARSRN
jgi:uncharacterized protein YqgC (DUF456 family)